MKILLLAAATAAVFSQAPGLKIVVIAGEDAINVIQQRSAVAPIVEVRDRNNLPVAGVPVTFTIGGSGASFGGGASTLTVTTNALGQATAAGLTPTASGAIHVTASAVVQGQTVTATIAQTNVMTAAQAAAAGGGTSSTAGTGGAAAGGGGISATTIGIIGAAVGGGALAATQTSLFEHGEHGFAGLSGTVFASMTFGPGGSFVFANPVAGATVSTSIDSTTATTDSLGRFTLVTQTKKSDFDGCRPYTIMITAAGFPTFSATGPWGTGTASGELQFRQQYAMSSQAPTQFGGGPDRGPCS